MTMEYQKIFYECATNVEKELLATMKESNLNVLNLTTADVIQHWDKLFTYRYNKVDELEERTVIGLVRSVHGNSERLDVVSVTNDEYEWLETQEDNDLSEYMGDDGGCVDALFGGNLLGVFTAYNLSEALTQLKELIREQAGI